MCYIVCFVGSKIDFSEWPTSVTLAPCSRYLNFISFFWNIRWFRIEKSVFEVYGSMCLMAFYFGLFQNICSGWPHPNSTGCCSQLSGETKFNATGFLICSKFLWHVTWWRIQIFKVVVTWHDNWFDGTGLNCFSGQRSTPPTGACLASPPGFLMG